ncbi:MAG: hypothetical protein VB071_09980, partial [Lawsonibacter sp.]|nr:hypothetical protein [Lawsonibacter sp.]
MDPSILMATDGQDSPCHLQEAPRVYPNYSRQTKDHSKPHELIDWTVQSPFLSQTRTTFMSTVFLWDAVYETEFLPLAKIGERC